MIKAIFFDIDGTLRSNVTHSVPASAINAIKELQNKGIKVFIATGRPEMLVKEFEPLGFDGYITMNGCHCYTANHEPVFDQYIDSGDVERLMKFLETDNTPFIFVFGDKMLLTGVNDKVEQVAIDLNIPIAELAKKEEAVGKNIQQMMGYFTAEEDEQKCIMSKVLPNSEAPRWHPLFTDINPQGCSKSRGIDEVIVHYGISIEETMAFGDGGNDIAMLKHTKIGVAMGNASEQVKEEADYVTDTVDNDGIAKALKHFNII